MYFERAWFPARLIVRGEFGSGRERSSDKAVTSCGQHVYKYYIVSFLQRICNRLTRLPSSRMNGVISLVKGYVSAQQPTSYCFGSFFSLCDREKVVVVVLPQTGQK